MSGTANSPAKASEKLVQLQRRKPTPALEPTTGPRVYVETYGCQMNVADTDLIRGLLGNSGFRRANTADEADVILLNTCAVRERAEERVFRRAEQLHIHKKRRPGTVIGVVGCMAEHLKAGITERAPYVDIVAGPDSYRRIAELATSALNGKSGLVDVRLDKAETYENATDADGDAVSGFVTIQRGCDKFCTFCVVPFTRGRERGVPPREVLRLVRQHAAAGRKEVTLLGQTVNSYVYENVTFAALLESVATVQGIERIRFTSPYPVDFTDDVIDVLASNPKVCGYVHLPVQSGSDAVLDRMRRGYTAEDFTRLVDRLRERVPNIALSTDILSGFCGETEDDHQATLQLMRRVRFDSAFMFSYSERDLTFAAKKVKDDVPRDIKKRRLAEIIALQEVISSEVFASHVGRTEHVLIHGTSKRSNDQVVGRTDGFKSVILPQAAGSVGDTVEVTITRSTMATLFAEQAVHHRAAATQSPTVERP